MKLLPSSELINDALQRGYAVPSFCAWCFEAMKTILDTAEELRAPVMVMNGWAEFPILGPRLIVPMTQALLERYTIPAALHLDHGRSIEEVRSGIEAGYTSVMLDFSTKPFEENVRGMREVVGLSRPRGITVEGELGAVGRVDEVTREGEGSSLTDPDSARIFVRETGIDLLAVSIGNAHGVYRSLPSLDFELLARLRDAVDVPLVLHGGSGTPDEDLKRAIALGIAKVNVASELVNAVRNSLMEQWREGKNLWIPLAHAPACSALAEVVRKWITRTGAAGRA